MLAYYPSDTEGSSLRPSTNNPYLPVRFDQWFTRVPLLRIQSTWFPIVNTNLPSLRVAERNFHFIPRLSGLTYNVIVNNLWWDTEEKRKKIEKVSIFKTFFEENCAK